MILYIPSHARREHQRGQTLVESIVMMPLFLTLVFLLLQIGHLGIAMAIVHFSASSAAKLAVETNNGVNLTSRVEGILSAGLTLIKVTGTPAADAPTGTMTVTVCAELLAYPFVGPVLGNALKPQTAVDGCFESGTKALGPIGLKGPPYKFIIQGEAKARMNYI